MEHQGGSRKIFGIIIDNAGTGNQVEVDVLYPTFVAEVIVVNLRFLVADAGKERQVRYPILGKHPIVTITEPQAIVGILDVAELQARTQVVDNGGRQFLIVERDVVLRIGKTCHEGAGTTALVGGLAVDRWIGKLAVIEYPVGIQSLDAAFQTVEVFVFQCRIVYSHIVEGTELEVASCLPVVEVDSEFGAVDVEGHLFLLGLVLVVAEEVLYIERVAQEYPSPSEVDAEFGSQARGEVETLGILVRIVAQTVMLIPRAVLQHEGQIVQIGRDVGGVYRIEALDLLVDFLSCMADSIGDVVSDFLLFLGLEAEGEENKKEKNA